MPTEPIVTVRNLNKTYRITGRRRLLAAAPFQALRDLGKQRRKNALRDLSFDLHPGEILGIIGQNGAGKSTLLKILAGVTRPDSGTAHVTGRITSLLELGVGFEPDLSGLENIYLYGSLMGIPRETVTRRLGGIIDFSGLADFIREPVKSYSSGMVVRLAFSVAAHSSPSVMVLDEVLGVGDVEFQHRCFKHIRDRLRDGLSVILVSHDLSVIGNVCSRVICLEDGRPVRRGSPETVIEWYVRNLAEADRMAEIRSGEMSVAFQKGCLHLFWNGRPVTAPEGCHLNINRSGISHYSTDAAWEPVDCSPDTIAVKGTWPHGDISQIWRCRCVSPGSMDWTIENHGRVRELADEIEIYLAGSSGYQEYLIPEGRFAMPPISSGGFYLESLLMRPHARRFMGLGGFSGTTETPGILIDFNRCPTRGASQIYNGNAFRRGRILSRRFPADPDRYEIQLRMMPDPEARAYLELHGDDITLRNRAVRVIFDCPFLHLESGSRRINGDRGLFVSLDGPETGVKNPEWEVLRTEPAMQLRCADGRNPVVYCWEFIPRDQGIAWTLDMECLDRVTARDLFVGWEPAEGMGMVEDLEFDPRPEFDETLGLISIPLELERSEQNLSPGRYRIASGTIVPGKTGP